MIDRMRRISEAARLSRIGLGERFCQRSQLHRRRIINQKTCNSNQASHRYVGGLPVAPWETSHMSGLFGHIANVVVPIALCVLIGYGLAVLKPSFDRKMPAQLAA